jgi:chromosome segregation ATPase
MKLNLIVAILVVACVGLVFALFSARHSAEDQHKSDVAAAVVFSNQVLAVNKQVNELGQVNLMLSNSVSTAQQQMMLSVEQLAQLSNTLAAANATLDSTKNSLASAQDLVTNLNSRISDLEAQNKVLDDQAASLSNQLASLTVQIASTRNQLAVSRGNAMFLQGELQKQLAQKAELEHKFNDVEELRQQIRKLKEQMWVARRIELNISGTLKKGGEILMDHSPANPPRRSAAYDLHVEVGSDGSGRVIPPATNAPAH